MSDFDNQFDDEDGRYYFEGEFGSDETFHDDGPRTIETTSDLSNETVLPATIVDSTLDNRNVTIMDNVIQQPFVPNPSIFENANNYLLSQGFGYATDYHFNNLRQRDKDIDDLYKKIKRLDVDEAMRLVYADSVLNNYDFDIHLIDKCSVHYTLINILKRSHPSYQIYHYECLNNIKNTHLLPDRSINWVKSNLRYALHIAYLVSPYMNNKTLVGKEELIDWILDYLIFRTSEFNQAVIHPPLYKNILQSDNNPLTQKIEAIKTTYFANCVSEKDVGWLDKENTKQIDWAYNSYLVSEKRDYLILQNSFVPQTLDEKYNLILASLDVLSNREYSNEIITKDLKPNEDVLDYDSMPKISHRDKVLKNMRGAWDKFLSSDENEGLSDVGVYKKNQSKFSKIVELEGKTPKQTLNKIIEEAYSERSSKY